MSTDRFREFETFVCVVETGSFSAASRKLGCTPSAVSKLIERMENRLGVRLVQRTSRSLTLTQEGRNLHRAAAHVLETVTEAEAALLDTEATATGLLRVHTTLNFAQTQLAPLLPDFLAAHPKLRIEFLLNSEPIDLVNADIDISLQVGPVTNPSLIARRIATTRWLLCAAPSYLLASGTPIVPADLLNHNCLNFLPQTYRSVWPLRDESKDASDDKSPSRYEALGNVASNSDNFLRVLACQGMGIARLAEFHIAQDLREGRLCLVLGDSLPDQPEPVFAVYQSRRNLSSRVKVFLAYLEKRLSESLEWKAKIN
ncbi:MAG: LysR family transcriptional regulator [Polaromonas sp.]|nr:LysR family transcriptional regulator [Hylemonella sp.]MDP1955838.1 LysR family transcriptional regulator [Polaromonas sp.]